MEPCCCRLALPATDGWGWEGSGIGAEESVQECCAGHADLSVALTTSVG